MDYYAHLAALAEGAAFRFVFVPDSPSVIHEDYAAIARVSRSAVLEPITLLSALSSRTQRARRPRTAATR
ncbi:LLM class flavin-dependent oxidoreductase [Bradyrhizobium sp. 170]|nr:LLM class flavin-dependent oxidoreductase [Bradyrhizobium sp. 170]